MFTFSQFSFASICLVSMLALAIRNGGASPISQATSDFTAVDRYIKTEMKRLGIPGMAVGIVHGNEIVHLQGYGVADSLGRPVTPQTPFYIGSVTKPFTALAVMQLAEAGKLDLDAPVQTYLPWFEVDDKESSAKVTVRHLLNQTSGISEKDGNRIWTSDRGLEDTLRGLGALPLTHPVGTTWQYSNINYSLAGLIVEKVSGQSYADYVKQNIFIPLDMRHTHTSRADALADGLSEGHYYMFGRPIKADGPLPPSYLPSGLLISTAEDMTHFMIAELNDGQYLNSSILSPQGMVETHRSVAVMHRGDYQYAMGWAVGTADGIPVLRHDGDSGRFHAIVFLQPDKKFGIVLLANASGFEQLMQVNEVAKGVLDILNDKQPTSASVPFLFRFLYWSILLTPLTATLYQPRSIALAQWGV